MSDKKFKFGYDDDIFIISLDQLGKIVSRVDFKEEPSKYLVQYNLERQRMTTETWHDEVDLYK